MKRILIHSKERFDLRLKKGISALTIISLCYYYMSLEEPFSLFFAILASISIVMGFVLLNSCISNKSLEIDKEKIYYNNGSVVHHIHFNEIVYVFKSVYGYKIQMKDNSFYYLYFLTKPINVKDLYEELGVAYDSNEKFIFDEDFINQLNDYIYNKKRSLE